MSDSIAQVKKLALKAGKQVIDEYIETATPNCRRGLRRQLVKASKEELQANIDANFYLNQWGIWQRISNGVNTGYSAVAFNLSSHETEILTLSDEECEAIDREIKQQEEQIFDILFLHYVKQLSLRDIARIIGLSRPKTNSMLDGTLKWFNGYFKGLKATV